MRRTRIASILLITMFAAACGSSPPRGLLGSYRFPDGRIVSVRPSVDNTLRYREFGSGRSGRLHRESEHAYVSGAGFSDRDPVTLRVQFEMGDDADGVARSLRWTPAGAGTQIGVRVGRERWVEFTSDGTSLAGRLHLPDGPGPFPAIVLVHGSGTDPGSDWLYNGDFFVAHGIAILAYDKRGTGESRGEFTFDFHQLARDAAAGVEFLRAQPEIHADRVGLSGYSQGGWVAPLAASISKPRFVLVSYGMMESPAEEARMEMLHLLEKGGVTGSALQDADTLVSAAVEVVASEFERGWDEFGRLKRIHKDAPWRAHLDGTPVAQLMSYPKWIVDLIGRGKLPKDLPWFYDSGALFDTLRVPMSWFLAEEDESAPNQMTIPRLRALEAAGLPYELELFAQADHGMLSFEEQNGVRIYTGYAPRYFRAEVEAALRWIDSRGEGLH